MTKYHDYLFLKELQTPTVIISPTRPLEAKIGIISPSLVSDSIVDKYVVICYRPEMKLMQQPKPLPKLVDLRLCGLYIIKKANLFFSLETS